MKYLTSMPESLSEYGLCKTLAVRREIIHIKHIFTEIFVRKTIDIETMLDKLNLSVFQYIEYMTNRIRFLHHINRGYKSNVNDIVKKDRDRFFPTLELLNGLKNVIVLDFDGVITAKRFKVLYHLCIDRSNVIVCTANPKVNNSWFEKRNYRLPNKIHSVQGKVKKIKTLLDINKRYDNIFYVDNEIEYLQFAWIFGVKTFHYKSGKIKYFTMKTK